MQLSIVEQYIYLCYRPDYTYVVIVLCIFQTQSHIQVMVADMQTSGHNLEKRVVKIEDKLLELQV